ncbi:diacylglycerol kinase [Alteromonas halophila]|uniref:Diacylglycerol kinase n=1 Tax=Alteromonas halophila TaxID=516698 RepID=A0A918JLU8_9ALTE|nr:diacylglycerol kinase [Alteromonas halophila]GGW88606.1 diacylglycerol kinase [Alteromonas halophila]
MRQKRTGLKRVGNATVNSINGLFAAFKSEAALRQEAVVFVGLMSLLLVIDISRTELLFLVFSLVLVFITELMNTAVEVLADRVSTETHALTGKCKDIASAAVFVSILLAVFTWITVLFGALN